MNRTNKKMKKSWRSLGVAVICLCAVFLMIGSLEGFRFSKKVNLQEALKKQELVIKFKNASKNQNQYYYTGEKITPKVQVFYKVPTKKAMKGYTLVPLEQGVDMDLHVSSGKTIGNYDVTVNGIEDKSKKEQSNDFKKMVFTGSAKATYEIIVESPKIKFNMSTIYLQKNQKFSLFKVEGLAPGDSVKEYKSSNEDIFVVNEKGEITAKDTKGSATLYVTLTSGTEGAVEVIVQNDAVEAKGVNVNTEHLKLAEEQKYSLKASNDPLSAMQKIDFATSDEKIATVDSDGTVVGKRPGKCEISVISGDYRKVIKVEVIDNSLPNMGGNSFLNTCSIVSKQILEDRDWIFSNGEIKDTFVKARNASSRKTNCAHYVSLCTQEYGSLKKGQTFFGDINGEIRANSKTMKEIKKNFEVIDMGKQPLSVVEDKLLPGDICVWTKFHTNIYVGKDEHGELGWLDAGRDMTTDGKSKSGVFSRLYKTSSFEEKELSFILRVKSR